MGLLGENATGVAEGIGGEGLVGEVGSDESAEVTLGTVGSMSSTSKGLSSP